MNPYGPTPPPYDPGNHPAPLAPSSYGAPGGGMGPPSDDTMAWVGVALSSAGWVSCCCGFVPILGLFAGLAGLAASIAGTICGYLAWQKAKQQNTRTDIALVGLVLGATRLALVVVLIGVVIVAMIAGVGLAGFEQYTHPH